MIISIITPTKNACHTIRDTLNSVANQDYPYCEHIIIDGISEDNTVAVASGYSHVSKIISEPDKGIFDAINKGIHLATGDIIGILNADDYYPDSSILSKVASIFHNTGIESLYGNLLITTTNHPYLPVRYWRGGTFHPNKLYFGWMPPHPTLFLQKKVYEKAGLFNVNMLISADYEMMLRLFLKNGISSSYLNQTLVIMRAGGISNASFRNRLIAHREDYQAWKLNHLKPYFFTLPLKPLRKIFQLFTFIPTHRRLSDKQK